jgi:hypothetical protein
VLADEASVHDDQTVALLTGLAYEVVAREGKRWKDISLGENLCEGTGGRRIMQTKEDAPSTPVPVVAYPTAVRPLASDGHVTLPPTRS